MITLKTRQALVKNAEGTFDEFTALKGAPGIAPEEVNQLREEVAELDEKVDRFDPEGIIRNDDYASDTKAGVIKVGDGLIIRDGVLTAIGGGGGGLTVSVVDSLPEEGQSGILYLVVKAVAAEKDLYDEYLWENNAWEFIGSKTVDIDLDDYYKKTETDDLLNAKQDKLTAGDGIEISEENVISADGRDVIGYEEEDGVLTIEGLAIGKDIIDDEVTSQEKTWSSEKINNTIPLHIEGTTNTTSTTIDISNFMSRYSWAILVTIRGWTTATAADRLYLISGIENSNYVRITSVAGSYGGCSFTAPSTLTINTPDVTSGYSIISLIKR